MPQTHRVPTPIPGIEIADKADSAGIWRPDRKTDPIDTIDRHRMGTKTFVGPRVGSFAKEVDVKITENRLEPVGVIKFDFTVPGIDAESISKMALAPSNLAGEKALRVDLGQVGDLSPGLHLDNGNADREREKRPDDHTSLVIIVHAKEGKWIIMVGANNCVDRPLFMFGSTHQSTPFRRRSKADMANGSRSGPFQSLPT